MDLQFKLNYSMIISLNMNYYLFKINIEISNIYMLINYNYIFN